MLHNKNKSSDLKRSKIDLLIEGIDFDALSGSPKVNNCIFSQINVCHSCNSDDLYEDTTQGILLCQNCGQILDELIDHNPEWKNYEDTVGENARCGAQINTLLPQSSLGTSISGSYRSRLKIIQGWNSMPYRERSLNNEFKKIHAICQKLGASKCIEDDTKIMYKIASESKHESGKNKGKKVITRGKNRISISAACMFRACEKKGMIYTPKEIADCYNISYADINHGIKKLRKLLEPTQFTKNNVNIPNQFIKRYCNNLKMLSSHTEEAMQIANNIEKIGIASAHNPYSLAAACILFVAEIHKLKHITTEKLAKEFNVSETTIIKTFKKIKKYKDILPNDNMANDLAKKINESDDDEIPEEIKKQMILFGILPDDSKKETKQTLKNINIGQSDDESDDDISLDSDTDDDEEYDVNSEYEKNNTKKKQK